jgi:hypothetical protein
VSDISVIKHPYICCAAQHCVVQTLTKPTQPGNVAFQKTFEGKSLCPSFVILPQYILEVQWLKGTVGACHWLSHRHKMSAAVHRMPHTTVLRQHWVTCLSCFNHCFNLMPWDTSDTELFSCILVYLYFFLTKCLFMSLTIYPFLKFLVLGTGPRAYTYWLHTLPTAASQSDIFF